MHHRGRLAFWHFGRDDSGGRLINAQFARPRPPLIGGPWGVDLRLLEAQCLRFESRRAAPAYVPRAEPQSGCALSR